MINIITLRSYKLGGIALFDLLVTFLVTYNVHIYMKLTNPLWVSFLGAIVLGIIVHMVTGTPTTLNYYLCVSEKPRSDNSKNV